MEKPTQYLAFDLGASQARAILGTLYDDRFEFNVVHRFETPLIRDNGHLYWNVNMISNELQKGLEKAVSQSDNLCSLSVSSWGVDYVPLDKHGTKLRKPYSYRDSRTRTVMDDVHEIVSEEEFYRQTGIKSMPINTLYQVYWDSVYEPELFEKTTYRLTIADYFNYLFNGKKVVEKSLASTTQMMHIKTGSWATELLGRLGLAGTDRTEIVPSGTILGPVERYPSIRTVASCSHDTACAVATVSLVSSGTNRAFLSSGTWSLLGVERSEPVLTAQALEAGFTNESGPGDSIRFLKNLTGLWVLQECEKEWKKEGRCCTYEQLMEEARTGEKEHQDTVIDLNEPQFSEPGDMVSKLRDYCSEKGFPVPESRGALAAVILKSLAASYTESVEQLSEITGDRIEQIHVVGGGSKNRLLCQWTADLSGCEVRTGPVEATATGNILLQARAMGNLPAGDRLKDIMYRFEALHTFHPTQK